MSASASHPSIPTSPPIEVVCAVLVDRENHLLAVQRGEEGSLAGYWEFPGGKVEPGEDHEAALRREIWEELSLDLGGQVFSPLSPSAHAYSFATIRLWPMVCRLEIRPDLTLVEHAAQIWLPLPEARRLDWAPADVPILDELERVLAPQ